MYAVNKHLEHYQLNRCVMISNVEYNFGLEQVLHDYSNVEYNFGLEQVCHD